MTAEPTRGTAEPTRGTTEPTRGTTEPTRGTTEPIAVIGMACIFPEAPHLAAFWRNIVQGFDAISDPDAAWDAKRYLDSGRIHTAAGGYLKDLYRFDPTQFGIMPSSLHGGEPDQFLALRVAADALSDGGYLGPEHDHRDTGVVLGHSTYLHRGQGTLIQNHIVVDQTLELLGVLCPTLDGHALEEVRKALKETIPACTVDIAPALVPNVMTGRIANRLDLKGPNYLIDAACSSSLLAVSAAMDELRAGRCKMMLAGGINASLPAEVNVIFTQLGALSRRGKVRPFEEGSDGTLLGEGAGVVLLKRWSDALADGDRVYCLLHTVGQASDGKGQGLLAPSVDGEVLAMKRAYQQSGIDPATISNVEAHGSGIALGDQTEIAALLQMFGGDDGPRESVAIGSIKSMISHCIPAAGIAGLIKTALALHHRVLPPTLCEKVNPALGIRAPLYVNRRARPWITPPGKPRRAGVNAFGFGGINTHAILEEAPAVALRPLDRRARPAELCVLSATTRPALQARIARLEQQIESHPGWSLPELAARLCRDDAKENHRLALVARDTAELLSSLKHVHKRLMESSEERFSTRTGCFYSATSLGGELAFVYPGEGSQYPHMLANLAMGFPEAQSWFDFWCGLYHEPPGQRRTDIVFSVDEQASDPRLFAMDIGSEASFIGDHAMHATLTALGVIPDVLLGHSSGESAALAASGAFGPSREAWGIAMRRLNEVYRSVKDDGNIPQGALLAVGALPQAQVLRIAQAISNSACIAMDNCSNQLVLYTPAEAAAAIERALGDVGAVCIRLPFDRGVHTASFEAGRLAFFDYYCEVGLTTPLLPLYSCATASLFPQEPGLVRARAAEQWSTTVRFRETIEAMYRAGVRAFVEVGPSGNLTSFIHDILKGRPYLAVASNLRRKEDVAQLLCTLGQLYVDRRSANIEALFADREITTIDWDAPTVSAARGLRLDNTLPQMRLCDEARKRLAALTQSFNVAEPFAVRSAPTALLGAPHVWTEERLVAPCHLDVLAQPFLRDHVLSGPVSVRSDLLGLACVPLMVSVEILAEACSLLAKKRDLFVISDVTALSWVALDELRVTLEAEATVIDTTEGLYAAELRGPGGPILRARYRFSPDSSPLEPLEELDEHRPSIISDDQLYSTGMFHGPNFQSISHIFGWSDLGIDAELRDCDLGGFLGREGHEGFVTNPIVLDAAGQLCAYYLCQLVGTDFNCFPSTIERIDFYQPRREKETPRYLLARIRPKSLNETSDETPLRWEFEYRARSGATVLRISGLTNVHFSVPHSFYEVRKDPVCGFLGRHKSDASSLTWELPLLPLAFLNQSEAIFARILAFCCLDEPERKAWSKLSCSPSERRAWLMEKICLKELVRAWVYQETGQLLYPTDVHVGQNEAGEAFADGWWTQGLVELPRLSLTRHEESYVATLKLRSQKVEAPEKARGALVGHSV